MGSQRSLGRARSNFLAGGHGTSDLGAVVLGFADVVGDVVGQDHLVSVNNLDGFVVGDVLNTVHGGSGNLTARLHGHGLSKSSDDLEPVLVLHAFVLAGRLSGRPDVVVLSTGSSLEAEGGLAEGVNLLHGKLTLDHEVECLDLGHTGGSSSAPVSAGSLHGSLARLKAVLSPEGVEVLLGSLALSDVELVVSDSVLESDLHDVIMDSLADSLGLDEGSFLGSSFLGSLDGSSDLGSDGTVSDASGNVSLSETESGVTDGTLGSFLSLGSHLSEGDSLSGSASDLDSALTDSESETGHVLGVGDLGSDSSSNGGSHGTLAEGNVGSDPFVELDGLDSESLLGLSLSDSSGSNGASDGGVGFEESLLDSEVGSVRSLVGGLGSAESGVSENSSTDGNSELLLVGDSGADGILKSELGSLEGSSGFTGNLLGLLHEVTDLIGVSASLLGILEHRLGSGNPHLGELGHLDGHLFGVSGLRLHVEVKFEGDLLDDEHLVSPLDSLVLGSLSFLVSSLGLESSGNSLDGTTDSFLHSLHGLDGVTLGDLGLLDLLVLKVDSNTESLVGSLGISLSLNSASLHLHGLLLPLLEESGRFLKVLDVLSELFLLDDTESGPLSHSLLVESKSDSEDTLVLLVSSLLPCGVDSVKFRLFGLELEVGGLDLESERAGGSLVNDHLGVESLVLAHSEFPGLDGEVSEVLGFLGDLVGDLELLPGGGGEFLLDNDLSSERGGSDLGSSGDLVEEDASGLLLLGGNVVLEGFTDSNDSKSIVLGVLGLGSLGSFVSFLGSLGVLLGVLVVAVSLLLVLSLLGDGNEFSRARFGSGLVGLGHEVVLFGDEDHGLLDNDLAVSNGLDHLLDGVFLRLDVSGVTSPGTSGLTVSLCGKSEVLELQLLFSLVSLHSDGLSGDEFLGSLLGSESEFVLTDSESGSSLGSGGVDLGSGFLSGGEGVVLTGLSEGSLLSSNSNLGDVNPLDSLSVLLLSVSGVLLSEGSGSSGESVPVGFLASVEFSLSVELLGHLVVVINHLAESLGSESEFVRLLLSDNHLGVLDSVDELGGNSLGNSNNRGSVGSLTVLLSDLGNVRPFLEEFNGNSGGLNVLLGGLVVLSGKSVSVKSGVHGDLSELEVLLGHLDSMRGLLLVGDPDELVLIVSSVELLDSGNVPVDLLGHLLSGDSDLDDESVDGSLTVLLDVLEHVFVLNDELGNVLLGGFDHLGVLNLKLDDSNESDLDGTVGLLGLGDPGLSGSVGLSVSLVGSAFTGEGLLGDFLVVLDILGSLLGERLEGDVLDLVFGSLGVSDGSGLVGNLDGFVSDSGVVSRLSGLVVVSEGELFGAVLLLDGSEVLLFVEHSESLGILGGKLGLEESFLGLDGTGNGTSHVLLSFSLGGSLDLDLGSVHSLGNLAGSDGVFSSDNSGGNLGNLNLGLSVLVLLSPDSVLGLQLSSFLELTGILGTEGSSDSSDLGGLGTSDHSNLA